MANKCNKVEVTVKGEVGTVMKEVKAEAAKHDLEIKGDTSGRGPIKRKRTVNV